MGLKHYDDLTDEEIEGKPNTLLLTMSNGEAKAKYLSDESLEQLMDGSTTLGELMLADD